jgi:hypothetical protein
MSQHTFYEIQIHGRTFEGVMSGDGPYIQCEGKGVALGSCCSINKAHPDIFTSAWDAPDRKWWICKYDNQPRIDIHWMSERERRNLSAAFGIPIGLRELGRADDAFWASPAAEALTRWVKLRPRMAKRFAGYDNYLPGWYERALRSEASTFPAHGEARP